MDPLGPVRLGLILDGTVPGAVLTYKIELRSWPDQFLGFDSVLSERALSKSHCHLHVLIPPLASDMSTHYVNRNVEP